MTNPREPMKSNNQNTTLAAEKIQEVFWWIMNKNFQQIYNSPAIRWSPCHCHNKHKQQNKKGPRHCHTADPCFRFTRFHQFWNLQPRSKITTKHQQTISARIKNQQFNHLKQQPTCSRFNYEPDGILCCRRHTHKNTEALNFKKDICSTKFSRRNRGRD